MTYNFEVIKSPYQYVILLAPNTIFKHPKTSTKLLGNLLNLLRNWNLNSKLILTQN